MVIIEVDRDFDQFERLLGLHSWSKFLSRPSGEEQDKESKVFWCHYNSGRLVQKHGASRVSALITNLNAVCIYRMEASRYRRTLVQGLEPEQHVSSDALSHGRRVHGSCMCPSKITFPYPKTTWCEEPSEAKTGVPLCRPLPQAHFPAPPKATASPPVGSPAWISAKSSDTSSVAKSSSRRKGDRSIAPSDSVSMISSASSGSGTNRGAQSPRASAASTVSTAWRMAEYRARQGASSGPPSVASLASPPGSRAPSTIDSRHGSRSRSSNGPAGLPAKPPGLDLQYERFDWGEEVDAFEAERDDEPTRSASSVSGNFGPRGLNAPDRYVPDPEGPVDPNQDYEYDDDNRPKRSIVAAMKEAFDGDSDDELTHDWGRDPGEVVDDRNPWNGYDAPRWEPPTKINRKGGEEWKCPDHGPLCNPGICKERARVERERREQKWREERQEAKRKREEKWEREKMKKENKAARDEGRELPHDLPPHVARGSDSDSDGDSGSTGGETEGNQGALSIATESLT